MSTKNFQNVTLILFTAYLFLISNSCVVYKKVYTISDGEHSVIFNDIIINIIINNDIIINFRDKVQSKVADKSLLFHVSCAIEAIKLLLLLSSQFLDSCE